MSKKSSSVIRLPWFGLPYLWPFIRPYLGWIIGMILAAAAAAGIDTLYPLFTRYAIDHFIVGQTTAGIISFAMLYLLILAGQTVLLYVSSYRSGQIEAFTDRDLRSAAFDHVQTLSFSYFDRNASGDILARILSDTGLIGEIVSWRLTNFVLSSAYILGALIVMLVIDARLTGYIILFVPAALIVIILFQKGLHPYHTKIRELNAEITNNYHEGITGLKTIKALGIEEKIIGSFRKDTGELRKVSIQRAHYIVLFISSISLLSAAVFVMVLWRGGLLVREDVMRIGTFSVFLSYAIEIISPMSDIVETMAALVAVQVNIERLTELLSESPDVSDTQEVIEIYGDVFNSKKENWEPLSGDVQLRDVTFCYPGGKRNVLEHFNLKAAKGTYVGIAGETGAGKTTLVNLICRFLEPTGGMVLIDGKDVRERSQLWLHTSLGYVFQTPYLFAGTIRDNLKVGKPKATDDEIMEALHIVSADFVTEKLEKGLDTYVGEGGGLLSTGEKQLLSFAQAILADPRILILDEATSSVDTLTEKKIRQAMKAAVRGRTSFVIAHRLSTISDADVILVLRDGKIVSSGTHEELMRERGYYYRLYTSQ